MGKTTAYLKGILFVFVLLLFRVESEEKDSSGLDLVNQNKELPQTLNYRTNLNVEQQMASDQIEQTVAGNHFSVTLLRGVTGSGKTEVFLSVASKFISEATSIIALARATICAVNIENKYME